MYVYIYCIYVENCTLFPLLNQTLPLMITLLSPREQYMMLCYVIALHVYDAHYIKSFKFIAKMLTLKRWFYYHSNWFLISLLKTLFLFCFNRWNIKSLKNINSTATKQPKCVKYCLWITYQGTNSSMACSISLLVFWLFW